MPHPPGPDDEPTSLSAARRAARTPEPVDAIDRLVQAWDALHAHVQEHGEHGTVFDPAWRNTPVLQTTAVLLEQLRHGDPEDGPDVDGTVRLLRGIGPASWPQASDSRAYLWHSLVMTWKSANVSPMPEAHRLLLVDAFLDAGLDPNASHPGLFAPLYIAVSQRDLPLAQRLVARGASVQAYHQRLARSSPDTASVALLNLAAQRNDPAMCAWLLEQGVPVGVDHAVLPQPLVTAALTESWAAFRVLEQAALRAGIATLPSPAVPTEDPAGRGPAAARERRRL